MKMLTPEECCSLLDEYMPPHIKQRKITQKLYIRLIMSLSTLFLCIDICTDICIGAVIS